jgi:leader peptidase (prepilin peptidase)/N-methyltransferase
MVETFLLVLLTAGLGASLGSFLNVVAERTLEDRPWWGTERSRCGECRAVLGVPDLVPVLSYLYLGGKCRHCAASIPLRCLGVELTGAFLGGLMAWRFGLSWSLPLGLGLSFGLLLNSLTDLYSGYIYDAFALSPGILCLALRLPGGLPALLDGILGAGLAFGFIALVIVVSRGGMGWGDAVLMAGVGAGLGWRLAAVALYLGLMCGGFFAVFLLAMRKVGRKTAIPLGPFLALGAVLALLTGPSLLGLWGWGAGWPWP